MVRRTDEVCASKPDTTLPASLHVADPIHIYYDLIPLPAVLSSCFTFLEPPDCPVRLITPRLPASDCL